MRKLIVSMLITYAWRWLTSPKSKRAAANTNRRANRTRAQPQQRRTAASR